MKKTFLISVLFSIIIVACAGKKTAKVSYPEKFEGLTQLILASETKTVVLSDTTVKKVLFFKIAEAQVQVTASVTFDFYMDFDKDEYSMSYNDVKDTLYFKAPPLKVKKAVINNTKVDYPEKSILINEDHEAVKKLQTLTEEFQEDGKELLKKDYVINKCTEMLAKHLKGMTKEMGLNIKEVIIEL